MSVTEEAKPTPVKAMPATSVLVLRDGAQGVEVLMIGRNEKLSFAAGMLVFPGGRVDATDSELGKCCAGIDGLDPIEVAARVAGLREIYEETGVLVARPQGRQTLLTAAEVDSLVEPLTLSLGRAPTFIEILATDKIELPTDEMVYFTHFITPERAPKRFDTRFYVVPAPPDQQALHDGSEAVSSLWTTPQKAFAAADAGEVKMMTPTRLNLKKLTGSDTVADALASARATASQVVPIIPDPPRP